MMDPTALEMRTWLEWLAVAEDAVRFLWNAHHLTRKWHDSESGWLRPRTAAADDDDAQNQDQEHRGMAYPRAKSTEGESNQTDDPSKIWRDEEAFLRDLRALMASVRDERTRAANRLRAGPPSPPIDYPASFGQLSAHAQWKIWTTSLLKCYEAGVPAESESEERHQAHAAVTILLGLQQLSGCAWLSFARISEIEKSVVACRLEFARAEQLHGVRADVLLPMGLAPATASSSSSSSSICIIEFQCRLESFFFLYHELSKSPRGLVDFKASICLLDYGGAAGIRVVHVWENLVGAVPDIGAAPETYYQLLKRLHEHAEVTYGKYDPLFELNLAPFAMELVFREIYSLASLHGQVDFHEADSLGQFLRRFAQLTYAGSDHLLWTSSLAWIMATLGCPLFVVESAKWLEDGVGMPPSHEGCSALKFVYLIAELQGNSRDVCATRTEAGSASMTDCEVEFGPSKRMIKQETLRLNPSFFGKHDAVKKQMDKALSSVSSVADALTTRTLYHGCSHSHFLNISKNDLELRQIFQGHDFGPAMSSALYFGDSGRAAIEWAIRRADPPSEPETAGQSPVIGGHVFVTRVSNSEFSQMAVLTLKTNQDLDGEPVVTLSKSEWARTVQYCRGAKKQLSEEECEKIQRRLDAADVVIGELATKSRRDGTWEPHHIRMRQYMLRTERVVNVFREAHIGLLDIEIAAIDAAEQKKWADFLQECLSW